MTSAPGNRTRPLLIAILLCARSAAQEWQGIHLSAPDRPAGIGTAVFDLWIPENLPPERPVRGVIASSSYETTSRGFTDPRIRQLAMRQDMAVMRYHIRTVEDKLDTSAAGAACILRILEVFAEETGRPELAQSGLVLQGVSWGAMQTFHYVNAIPERVIAALPWRGTARDMNAVTRPEARRVPILHIPAGRETFNHYRPMDSAPAMNEPVSKGAPWAFHVTPAAGHADIFQPAGDGFRVDIDYVIRWLEQHIELRVPEHIVPGEPQPPREIPPAPGWAGTFELHQATDDRQTVLRSDIRYFATEAERPADAQVFFPTEALARAWQHHNETWSSGYPKGNPLLPEDPGFPAPPIEDDQTD
ncbi:MAG: hypothetical protein LAT83_15835 [Kiritimatiellae bacterium]|nr:hypothetical protein [Kiritimatiellia bacterium]